MSKTALHDYLSAIEKDYKSGQATEHTYRTALKVFLEAHGTNIFARNEPKRIKCGAPDYMVEHNNLTIGYVEAKDIGIPLDKIEKDEQLKRYLRALDNLVLTDYLEFRWYIHGEKQMTARLATPRADKRLSPDKEIFSKPSVLKTSSTTCMLSSIRPPTVSDMPSSSRSTSLAYH
jgi:hypothetical protein